MIWLIQAREEAGAAQPQQEPLPRNAAGGRRQRSGGRSPSWCRLADSGGSSFGSPARSASLEPSGGGGASVGGTPSRSERSRSKACSPLVMHGDA